MAAVVAAAVSHKRRMASTRETALKNMESHIENASASIQTGDIDNSTVYSKTCMKLGSSIDSAIAVDVLPSSFHLSQLLLFVKEVYRRKTELLQPSLMLLILPIKAACQIGWFQDVDKAGLIMIANEVSYGFSTSDKMNVEPNNAHSSVSNIVSRFYPTMKVEHILTSLDVKAGYGTFLADFHISYGTTPRNCQKLWLLVAQLDNMETSACITNPLNVQFLINGRGVPNRTKIDMGKGPQLPSNVNKMIKYGVNLLQVFGVFDGPCIISLAFMNSISSPDPSELQDYLRPISDCSISSRISLYCPISQHRIKTPVKGYLCKHQQCFDYNHYIKVNSTKPTWECPLCNSPVCNQDLRIDQDFQKILNEVAEDVDDVIISEDGSWMAADTERDTLSQTTVTTPAVSLGQTQVNLGTTAKAQSTTVYTPTAVSLGQTEVNAFTTNQAQNMTQFTPPATVTKPAVPLGQTEVNLCKTEKAQGTSVLTPTTGSLGQTQVNAFTTNQPESTVKFKPPATVKKPAVSLGQTQVNLCKTEKAQSTSVLTSTTSGQTEVNLCKTEKAQGTSVLTPTTGSFGQTQVNAFTTNQPQSTVKFKPPATVTKPAVSLGQTQVNLCKTEKAQSTSVLTPTTSSLGQTQVNAFTAKQGQSRTMFTPPAAVTKPGVSPGQPQVNACTTTQAQSTTIVFTPPAAVTKPAVSPGQPQVNGCTTTQPQSITTMFPPPASFAPASNELRKEGNHGGYTTLQPAPKISQVSPTEVPEASGDAMPSGRMRGSLRGDKLQAARLQYLAPPQQPARANKPWFRPPIPGLPMPFLTPKTPTNSEKM